MKSKARLWLIGLALLISGVVHAEGNCPEGYYPIGGESGQAGPQGCAPIPGYNQNEAPVQQPPPEQWADHWGAIATDATHGTLGTATNMASQSDAEKAAMMDCQSKGGSKCKIDTRYRNACAAMVAGDTGYNVGSAVSVEEAIEKGMKICAEAGTTHCHVYYSACSLPQRIQ